MWSREGGTSLGGREEREGVGEGINYIIIQCHLSYHFESDSRLQNDERTSTQTQTHHAQLLTTPCGAVWSSVEQCGAVWSSVEQCGAVWSSVEQYGAVWSSVEQCGAVWSNVEQYGAVCSSVQQRAPVSAPAASLMTSTCARVCIFYKSCVYILNYC